VFYSGKRKRHCLSEEVGMSDSMLGLSARFDWFSPLVRVLGDLMNGPSHTFLIPYQACPFSGREISWMLSKRGVKSWGHMVVSGTLMFTVRQSQAQWAQHVLGQAGVPIENPLPALGRARGNRGRSARAIQSSLRSGRKSNRRTVVDSINDVLNMRLS
jgi:hypothetical protein